MLKRLVRASVVQQGKCLDIRNEQKLFLMDYCPLRRDHLIVDCKNIIVVLQTNKPKKAI